MKNMLTICTGWLFPVICVSVCMFRVKIFQINFEPKFSVLNISGKTISSLVILAIRSFFCQFYLLYCIIAYGGKTVTYNTHKRLYTKQKVSFRFFKIIIENVEIVMKCMDDCWIDFCSIRSVCIEWERITRDFVLMVSGFTIQWVSR